jgi:hypothetical protein
MTSLRARTAENAGRTWLLVHLTTLVASVPVLAWVNRHQWFTGDEWYVVTNNGLGSNPTRASIFAPHFEHWSTLGILVYKALYGVFALRTYVPYVAVLIVVIIAVAHMTWRVLLRVGVVPAYATAVAALTTVLAVGWENRSNAWQITIIAPVALGFGALLLLPLRGTWQRADLGVSALLLVGLACSGVGVTMTVVVTIAALLRRGWRVTLAIVAPPAAIYALWYAREGTSGQRNTVALSTALRDSPAFVWRGLTGAFSGLTRISGSGAIVLIALLVWVVWRARVRKGQWPIVVATTAGAVASIALTSLRRADAIADASRYSDIVILLALPALALATQEAGQRLVHRFGRPALALCAALIAGFLVVQIVALNGEVSSAPFEAQMRPRVLATARVLRGHEPIVSNNIFAIFYLKEPSTTTIGRLDRNGELPALDVSHADVLTAREYVEMSIGAASPYPEDIAELVTVPSGRVRTPASGCIAVDTPSRAPVIVLRLHEAASFRVASNTGGDASISFQEGDAHGQPRAFALAPGAGATVSVARPTELRLVVPRKGATVCGLAPVTTG